MPLSRAMPLLGAGAAELRVRDSAGIYRAFYVVKVADAVLFTPLRRRARRHPTEK